MPKLHPRKQIVDKATSGLRIAIVECTKELTEAEAIMVVTDAFANEIQVRMKYAIRMERHGNTDTPGGWAPDGG